MRPYRRSQAVGASEQSAWSRFAWVGFLAFGAVLAALYMFVAPLKGDFRLQPGSPADKVGFKMPDFSAVGVRPPSAR